MIFTLLILVVLLVMLSEQVFSVVVSVGCADDGVNMVTAGLA